MCLVIWPSLLSEWWNSFSAEKSGDAGTAGAPGHKQEGMMADMIVLAKY